MGTYRCVHMYIQSAGSSHRYIFKHQLQETLPVNTVGNKAISGKLHRNSVTGKQAKTLGSYMEVLIKVSLAATIAKLQRSNNNRIFGSRFRIGTQRQRQQDLAATKVKAAVYTQRHQKQEPWKLLKKSCIDLAITENLGTIIGKLSCDSENRKLGSTIGKLHRGSDNQKLSNNYRESYTEAAKQET